MDLFVDISEYVVQVGKVGSPTTLTTHSKKRKLDRNGTNGADNAGDTRWLDETPFFRADDSSVSMPQRKKLRLEFVRGGGIKAINPTSSEIEYTIRWENIGK